TFKEDVADIRNSKVVDLICELEDFSIEVDVIDPHASAEEVKHEYGISLKREAEGKYDAIVVAVGHKEYVKMSAQVLQSISKGELMLVDIKGIKSKEGINKYWKL
ncbi:MAG: UDP binding domain-containing protein, partial [Saprospiraceae bacterium]